MKLYISLDMEGVAGTFNWRQEESDREHVRKYMTKQIEWVIEGINQSKKNSEIKEILIADSHSYGDNLLYDITELDDRIHLVSGNPRPQYMMPALDESYDIIFFIGYHAGVGALQGSMDHTYSSRRVHNIWINNKTMSESLINAAYGGYYNIPVALVIGDDALETELIENDNMPWVKYISTKTALSKFSAKLRPISLVKRETIEKVIETLNSDIKQFEVLKFEKPYTLKIEFANTAMADVANLMPETKRLDGRTIEYSNNDYKVLFDALAALITLTYSV